ncbi:hypothetical protein GXW83_05570 [Streptacidiphilus sp. PB12-B1b]|uniref:DUF5719 family protein n=1 Tax=Streptacidiphilus sp. PB12-B1b TaxID=2705012 RepID=UPI0015FE604F|nr:DUF5719 family protein [Streptacidiphilus sp. PB12-B1b]QMU75307.1 hypothetical protein GXW83_05570 [Streptacidiphilus sp. PB12-B1b]
MISRTTQSLLGAVGVLALAVGIAEVHPPTGQAAVSGTTVRTAVQNTSLVCPPPLQGSGGTVYSLAAPGSASSASTSGSASLQALAAAPATGGAPSASASAPAAPAQTVVTQTSVGGSTTAKAAAGDKAPALLAAATGATAPGFTVQQTTTTGAILSGTACTAPGTDFWFAGADSNKGSNDVIELTNTESTASDADIHIFNVSGEVEDAQASNLDIPADGSLSLSLSSLLSPFNTNTALAVHVVVHTGRIAAALHADSGSKGADWIPATTLGTTQIISGLPGDLSDATLVVADPGTSDADLNVQLASQSGWITPAGHETVQVKAGTVTSVDLGAITRGQPAALRLSPASDTGQAPAPVVAGIEVVRGSGTSTDTGYLTGTGPIGERATAAGLSAGDSTLLLTATGAASTVKVSSVGGSGSTPVVQQVTIPAGTTVAVTPKAPSGGGTFAVTVEPASGGPVYAARMISRKSGSVPGFTLQQLSDDHSTVEIPHVVQDGSVLLP